MDIASTSNLQSTMQQAASRNDQARMQQMSQNLQQMNPKKMDKINAAAKDFEAVFISQMMSHMFSSVEVDPMFGGGQGEEMFRSMMVEEYGKQLAASGGIGIAEQVTAKLIDMQAAANSQPQQTE